MNRETELAFWQESREQWAARLESPDEGDRDVLLSHKWAREQLDRKSTRLNSSH